MRKVALGTAGLEITPVGLGTFSWAPTDDRDAIATIHRAIASGVRWIDTAPIYGEGHAEELVGQALAEVPRSDWPLVFTKCGMIASGDGVDMVGDPASTRVEAERSLGRFGVEALDLLQLHWPPTDGTPLEEAWGGLVALRSEGLARHVGVSNFTSEQLATCEAIGHVDTLQPPFSMLDRSAADAVEWCFEHGAGVIAYSPMAQGMLSGAFTRERALGLGDDDYRQGGDDFSSPRLERNLDLIERLRPIAARLGCGLPALAVAWVASWKGIDGAIVGARRPDQVDDWSSAAALALDAEVLAEIKVALSDSGAGVGPLGPG